MAIDPVAHDTKLAALYEERAKLSVLLNREERILQYANTDTIQYANTGTNPRAADRATRCRAKIASLDTDLQANRDEITKLNEAYTGWSRFFLVTSSQGHIHSSRGCSTCRPSTEFGWLPELSGHTELDAVAKFGPALCTVCFPNAPAFATGFKITASKAKEAVWSSDREERNAKRAQREQEKMARKAKKEANALKYAERIAPKINMLADRFGWAAIRACAWFAAEEEFGYQAASTYEDIQRERARRRRVA